ncbi:MAG TPA: sialate O-acetylesterase [Ruminococcaceae bacterium]|nr:sialate O-acetylesterase [Oscillospiraceae bacterium]
MSIFGKKSTEYNAEKRNKMINYEHLNKHYCQMGQTVLAGDSITEIFNHTELYADYTAKSGLTVYNRGISGDTSDRLLERFESNVLNLKPSNIVLLIGTNDYGYGLPMQETVDNIEKILIMVAEKCSSANVILQAVYPVNGKLSKYNKKKNAKISVLNTKIKAVAERYCVTFLDLTKELADQDGDFRAEYTYDGLHPNVFGFEKVAERVIPLLE